MGAGSRDTEAVTGSTFCFVRPLPRCPSRGISGTDHVGLHMQRHLPGSAASPNSSQRVWGLAVWLCEYGSARFGLCADERCGQRLTWTHPRTAAAGSALRRLRDFGRTRGPSRPQARRGRRSSRILRPSA